MQHTSYSSTQEKTSAPITEKTCWKLPSAVYRTAKVGEVWARRVPLSVLGDYAMNDFAKKLDLARRPNARLIVLRFR